jgi:hypothetical protein
MRNGRPATAERTFNGLITRFSADPSMAIRSEVLAAQVNRADAIARMGRNDEARAALTLVVDRYAGAERQDMIDEALAPTSRSPASRQDGTERPSQSPTCASGRRPTATSTVMWWRGNEPLTRCVRSRSLQRF